jgi:hypothetical protein
MKIKKGWIIGIIIALFIIVTILLIIDSSSFGTIY